MAEGYLTSIFIQIGINIILGLGLYVTFATGQISLGHAGFMAIGGYASAVITVMLGGPLWLALMISAILAGLCGVIVGWPALRLGGVYLAIATLGFGIIVMMFFENFPLTGGSMGMQGMTGTTLELVYGILLVITFMIWQLMDSRWGRAFYAVKEDEIAAKAMGINVTHVKLLAFGLGASLAGIAGALDAHFMFYIDSHNYTFMRSVEMLLFLVLGGSEVIWGPILGATILTALPEVLRFMAEYRMVFYGFLMVLMMIVRPQGLLDRKMFIKRKMANG